MGCVGSGPGSPRDRLNTKSINVEAFKKIELDLISLMYDNLAKRCRNNLVTRQTFDLFFHSSGLIGQILFLKFDKNKTGAISFPEFLSAFELMIKGSLRQRADILFEIYDVNNTGGVRYQQLLKIVSMLQTQLFSYNIEELNKMFVEPKFLEYVGVNQLNYYFGAQHKKIELKNILVEDDSAPKTASPKKEITVPQSVVLYPNIETSSKNIPVQNENKRKEQLHQKFNKPPSEAKTKNIAFSTLLHYIPDYKKQRKNMKIQSNVASLTKKYANYLFSSAGLNKEKDVFSKENFFHLIQEHPSLFNAYLTGFHTYIWQADQNDQPEYFKAIPWIESEALERFHDNSREVFLKFIQKTVFVMKGKKKKIPVEIINLEGLTVDFLEEHSKEDKEKVEYGIVFKHRDGLYDTKEYYFQTKTIYDQWCKHLSDFRSTTVQNLYTKLEKIGGGNFSSVFRGKDKKNGQEVAIKIIETFKLSIAEKEVLKRETGILKQCHHPNIIKFFGQFKTKTHIYIITEILSEGDLFQYTKKNSFLEEYEAAIILKQLVDAIIYLNEELGIIHRDLKPENVLIKMNEEKKIVLRVKLIDFGFGVFKDKIKDLSLKQKFAGTPGFIAPQIYNTEDYDDKVDTFSLGIILFFMLSGKFPFHSPFLEEIESLTKSCTISLQNNHWSNVSDQAKDLLTKILCFKDKRITTRQVSEHPWLSNIDKLKKYMGRNPKNVKGYLQ